MEQKKQATLLRKSFLTAGATLCLGLAAYLPTLAILFSPLIVAAAVILFLNKSKLFYVVSALVLLFPLSYLGDMLAVLFTFLIASGIAGVLLALRVKKYLIGAGVAIAAVVIGFLSPALVYLTVYTVTAEDSAPTVGKFVSGYVKENRGRADIALAADFFYLLKEESAENTKLTKTQDGYRDAALEYFSAGANRWAEDQLYFFILSYASFTACLSFLLAYFLYRRFGQKESPEEGAGEAGADKIGATEVGADKAGAAGAGIAETGAFPVDFLPAEKTVATGFIKTEPFTVDRVILGKKYALYVFLPASLLAFLGYFPVLAPVTSAIFNALVIVPCFLAAGSLFLYVIFKVPNRALRIGVTVFMSLVFAASLVFTLGMLIIALFGLADAIINVRKLLDYALS